MESIGPGRYKASNWTRSSNCLIFKTVFLLKKNYYEDGQIVPKEERLPWKNSKTYKRLLRRKRYLSNKLTNQRKNLYEHQVNELLTKGITYKGVSSKLFISETTVKTHVNNIFQKLQVNDRTQAVLYAINNGFMTKRKQKIVA